MARVGGRQAVPLEEKKRRGEKMRALRERRGFKTQEALADAADDHVERTTVNVVESGKNALSSFQLQRSFARALDVEVEDLCDYLDDVLTLDQLLKRREAQSAASLLARLRKMKSLREWVAANDVSVSELARVAVLIDEGKAAAYSAGNDFRGETIPMGGWAAFFDDVRHNRLRRRPGTPDAFAKVREKEDRPTGRFP